jgi:UDP-glucose 4-epimerase
LYVQDCVDGILTAVQHHEGQAGTFSVYNLGTDETVVVNDSIGIITQHLGLAPRLEYTGGIRGWAGDSPLIHLDCSRMRSLGWKPRLTIRKSIEQTLDWLAANPYALSEPTGVR